MVLGMGVPMGRGRAGVRWDEGTLGGMMTWMMWMIGGGVGVGEEGVGRICTVVGGIGLSVYRSTTATTATERRRCESGTCEALLEVETL